MYCPICGQQQVSDVTRFCSRCGFLLTGVAQVIANHGNVPFIQPASDSRAISPRRRGVLQGVFLMLLTFLIVPFLAILGDGLHFPDMILPMAAVFLPVGGFLRIIYALMFESSTPAVAEGSYSTEINHKGFSFKQNVQREALPPQPANFNPLHQGYTPPAAQPIPARGNWHEANTNELVMPPSSVTEDTTKLLEQQGPK